jgi:hypothetical protein
MTLRNGLIAVVAVFVGLAATSAVGAHEGSAPRLTQTPFMGSLGHVDPRVSLIAQADGPLTTIAVMVAGRSTSAHREGPGRNIWEVFLSKGRLLTGHRYRVTIRLCDDRACGHYSHMVFLHRHFTGNGI